MQVRLVPNETKTDPEPKRNRPQTMQLPSFPQPQFKIGLASCTHKSSKMIITRRTRRRQSAVSKPLWIFLLGICLFAASTTIRARIELSHEGLSGRQTILLPRRKLSKSKSQPSSNTSVRLETHLRPASQSPPPQRKMQHLAHGQLDFIIAGFPKCGTTTLLYALRDHKETDIASSERCAVANPGLSESQALEVLSETVAELSPSPDIKRGIKCPTILRRYKTIANIEQHSPSSKFVVGLRHPIKMLESFYNYRVTEIYDNNRNDPIPSFDDVVRREKPWKGISKDTPRFDRNLMQFGKTSMSKADLQHFVGQYNMAVRPSKAKIFLYTLDQLNDTDTHRSKEFRQGLQSYLGLQTPLEPLGHENLNHFVGKKAHPETVDICEDKYRDLRTHLLARGIEMASWISEEFLQSPDVSVGNTKHFLKSLDSWGKDPCLPTQAEALADLRVLQPKRRKQP